jgi:hypothetical protein
MQTEECIIEAFTNAGLRFERLSKGGFKMMVRGVMHCGAERRVET